jgi:hypothetical protein
MTMIDPQAEAERRYPADQSAPYRVRDTMLPAFVEGAEWAARLAWAEGYAKGRRDGAEAEQMIQMRDWWGEMPNTENPYE